MNEKERSGLIHRNFLGMLGMLLPVLSIIGGLFVKGKPESWWYSISVTYYITPVLPIVLGSCAIFFMCYRSYETIDTVINILSGIFAMCVVLFPCENPYGLVNVGFFQIPVAVSSKIHSISAILLFAFLAYNIAFLFTKGKSQARNRIYRICAIIMAATMIIFAIAAIIKNKVTFIPDYLTMIVEAILLWAFGIAWLTKGRAIFKNLD